MERKYVLAAYVYEGGKGGGANAIIEEDLFKLTHINYAFALIKDGAVTGDHLKEIDRLNELKKKNPELKTLISVGGWGAGGFSEAASTAEGRARFADTAAEFMEAKGFDGIDIDWEYPCSSAAGIKSSPDDKYTFTLLIKDLRDRLDELGRKNKRHYLLTAAVGAGPYFIHSTEMDKVQQYLDFVNLMTYDMRGYNNITGHHTNLYAPQGDPEGMSGAKAVELFHAAGVPLEKMVLGAAFYSRIWTGVENKNNGLHQRAQGPAGFGKSHGELLRDYINKNGFVRYWDDSAKAPYLFNGDTFITYDDEESLAYKAEYVKSKGLAGIMFWQYSHDESHTLVDRLYRELKHAI